MRVKVRARARAGLWLWSPSSTFLFVPHLSLKSPRPCSFPHQLGPNIQSWLGLLQGNAAHVSTSHNKRHAVHACMHHRRCSVGPSCITFPSSAFGTIRPVMPEAGHFLELKVGRRLPGLGRGGGLRMATQGSLPPWIYCVPSVCCSVLFCTFHLVQLLTWWLPNLNPKQPPCSRQ